MERIPLKNPFGQVIMSVRTLPKENCFGKLLSDGF
jgi:hypothetical protein